MIGLLSCSSSHQNKGESKDFVANDSVLSIELNEELTSDKLVNYRKIVLKENSIDTFALPFSKRNMLKLLTEFYKPYRVERGMGQQDGPDYPYIEILKPEKRLVHFIFNPESKYSLDEIRVSDTSVVDQYGIRVGDSYDQLIAKRHESLKNYTDYHQHIYLYADTSNIYYELEGDVSIPLEMVDRIENVEFEEEQLKKCRVQYIIWRKRK